MFKLTVVVGENNMAEYPMIRERDTDNERKCKRCRKWRANSSFDDSNVCRTCLGIHAKEPDPVPKLSGKTVDMVIVDDVDVDTEEEE